MHCWTGWARASARRLAEPLEEDFVARMRGLARHPAARGLLDDAAVLDWPLGLQMVATHDLLVEDVHYTAGCPASDVAWKLLAVNLSDLAAMGARPVGVLLGVAFGARQQDSWADGFAAGLARALEVFQVPLLGGDTVRGADRCVLSLTALGSVPAGAALGRAGAGEGDDLWVSGTIGDAGMGLAVALGQSGANPQALKRYRRPTPRLALGLALRGLASAAMDVSDGLALDAARLAHASGLAAEIILADIPLSDFAPASEPDRLRHATAGDDYELLVAATPAQRSAIEAAASSAHIAVARIGRLVHSPLLAPVSARIRLVGSSGQSLVPATLGYEHR